MISKCESHQLRIPRLTYQKISAEHLCGTFVPVLSQRQTFVRNICAGP